MKKFLITLAVVISLFFGNELALAQKSTLRIGVIDYETVLKEMPEAIQADKQLRELQKSYADSLQGIQEALMKKYEAYQKQKGFMTPDAQKKEEETLQMEQQKFMMLRETFTNDIQKKQEELLIPIKDKVTQAVKQIAKDEGMSLVLNKGNAAVVFSDDQLDVTFRVIDKIKRGAEK